MLWLWHLPCRVSTKRDIARGAGPVPGSRQHVVRKRRELGRFSPTFDSHLEEEIGGTRMVPPISRVGWLLVVVFFALDGRSGGSLETFPEDLVVEFGRNLVFR